MRIRMHSDLPEADHAACQAEADGWGKTGQQEGQKSEALPPCSSGGGETRKEHPLKIMLLDHLPPDKEQ